MNNILENLNDLSELWQFMKLNIKYGWTNKEHEFRKYGDPKMNDEYFIHSANETINDGYGICMDMVQLEKEFCQLKNIPFNTISFNFKDENGVYKNPGHIFLIAYDDGKYKYFERAFTPCANIVEFDNLDDAIITPIVCYIMCFENLSKDDISNMGIFINLDYQANMTVNEIYKLEKKSKNMISEYADIIKNNFDEIQKTYK